MSNPPFRAGDGPEDARSETSEGALVSEDLPAHARPRIRAALKDSPDVPAVEASRLEAPTLAGKDERQSEEVDVLPFAPPAAHFNLLKMGGEGPTLLVIGGIQGDEPGGFSAAAILSFAYRIHKGRLWVVPDLNFPSILRRSRGVSGDMNRKFAALDVSDPEFGTVSRIKSILLDEEVDLVLNLHDGSGFYRPNWEDKLRNPQRWGQSLIIDQEKMIMPPFLLKETAGRVEAEVNAALLEPAHRYHIYNTLTAEGNKEMAKTLSWFSVRNGKPAFGIEASKEFGTEYRTYYHLRVVEAFMRFLGIEFERDFTLDPKGVRAALNSNILLSAFEDRVILHLDNVRPRLSRIPFRKGRSPDVRASKPLLALVREKDEWRVAYGNNTLTRIKPEFMDFDESLQKMELIVDGEATSVSPGEIVQVREYFLVNVPEGYRVNAIGAQKEVRGSEAGVLLRRKDFMPRFSLDKGASVFRVEAYKGKAFSGMILVRFGDAAGRPKKPLTARSGPESKLGF
ncbi:MAG: deacylase [Desulfovibrio sp.]|nr:deacylase [Desulfovibrio sp.]